MVRNEDVGRRLIILRIIFFALLFGQLVFFIVAHVVDLKARQNQQFFTIILVIGGAFCFAGCLVSLAARMMMSKFLKSCDDPDSAMSRFFTVTLITLAICEGASLQNMVFSLLMGFRLITYIFIGLLIVAQCLHFPTQFRFENAWEDAKRFD